MGLDMRPMGKPKTGFEKRYIEIFEIISGKKEVKLSFWDKFKGNKLPVPKKEELLKEWFDNQIQTYETIKAPKIGRDEIANKWLKEKYEELDEKPSYEEFLSENDGFYVIELAEELDGVPVYISIGEDENVFRGEFLRDCEDILGEDLLNEAWNTKLGAETLDYGNRLMKVADRLAKENNLEYLKTQRIPPEDEEDSLKSKLHIIYSLAKWLIFYGKNGHGYEAYF